MKLNAVSLCDGDVESSLGPSQQVEYNFDDEGEEDQEIEADNNSSSDEERDTFENEYQEASSNQNNSNGASNGEEPDPDITEEEENGLNSMDIAIVKSIFEALDIIKETGASLNTFQDLLVFARHMFCRGRGLEDDDQAIKEIWPSGWESAKKYLEKFGYQDAKEYFICLDDSHKQHWDIMERETDTCRHCGQHGTIKYYYLGLRGKVKHWVSMQEMCYKMTAHWREKEHWLGRQTGWPLKREVWDGDRFCELSWFWDPNKAWCLPARCQTENCTNIISGKTIESLPESPNFEGSKEVSCKHCHSKFLHELQYARGDPRNLALIAHWDGFQPFGNKKKSTGAIDVTIATMAKRDRLCTEEVYPVGFVPSYDLPDGRPNSIDPFLEPLVQDLEEGFIEGTWLNEERHYYYPGFHEHFRHPWRKRVLEEELVIMKEIEQEERTTYFQSKSRDAGFNGLSLLHRLNPLYGFNILTDFVIDAMHLLPLNIVKNHLKLITDESMDEHELAQKLKEMPWTTDYKSSRLPTHYEYLGFWKAEEYQKFAFPASEFVFHGLLTEDQYKLWAPVPRLIEFVFNAGRDGWTLDMIQNFNHLSWRYCILMEENFGTQACKINLHNLIHFHEDIVRFSAPDNFWCTQFERAVSRYVQQSSNRKYFEKNICKKRVTKRISEVSKPGKS
ncbi:hypothetical protein QZH41_017201 [Actinostola sp. cb2023]|nr:hypothetical protein QZH41_017201 [Actinostola sp. cb2023]